MSSGPGQVVRFRASAGSRSRPAAPRARRRRRSADVVLGELLQDREHHVLLAQRGRVLDLQFLGESQQLGGGFAFQFLEVHGLHWLAMRWRMGPDASGVLQRMRPAAQGGLRRRCREVRRRDRRAGIAVRVPKCRYASQTACKLKFIDRVAPASERLQPPPEARSRSAPASAPR